MLEVSLNNIRGMWVEKNSTGARRPNIVDAQAK